MKHAQRSVDADYKVVQNVQLRWHTRKNITPQNRFFKFENWLLLLNWLMTCPWIVKPNLFTKIGLKLWPKPFGNAHTIYTKWLRSPLTFYHNFRTSISYEYARILFFFWSLIMISYWLDSYFCLLGYTCCSVTHRSCINKRLFLYYNHIYLVNKTSIQDKACITKPDSAMKWTLKNNV